MKRLFNFFTFILRGLSSTGIAQFFAGLRFGVVLILMILMQITVMSSVGVTADSWRDGSTSFFGGTTTLFNDVDTEVDEHMIDPLERWFLSGSNSMIPIYSSASAVSVVAGSVACENSTSDLLEFRRNTSATSVGWSDIDTGAEATSTTYYIFASCDADATTATFKISASATTPTGLTLYKNIGNFYNNSSGDIDVWSVNPPAYHPTPTDSSGDKIIDAVFNYSTSISSYTSATGGLKVAYGSVTDITGGGSKTITNLPFSSSSTYAVVIGRYDDASTYTLDSSAIISSGSSFSVYNNHSDATDHNGDVYWIAFGY